MSTLQADLFPEEMRLAPVVELDVPPADTRGGFLAFHAANPHVYTNILHIALRLKERHGFSRGSMKAIFEKLRWDYALQTRGDTYALNNSYTSHYSRLVMDQVPEMEGFFEIRRSRLEKAENGNGSEVGDE